MPCRAAAQVGVAPYLLRYVFRGGGPRVPYLLRCALHGAGGRMLSFDWLCVGLMGAPRRSRSRSQSRSRSRRGAT